MKDIKKELNNWRDILCSEIVRLNIIKMSVHKLTYGSNAILIKIQVNYFIDIDSKADLK